MSEEKIRFYNPKEEPFTIHGLYNPLTEDCFKRLPDDVAKATSPGVAGLYKNTAGGRVRFATDSPFVVVRARIGAKSQMPHCTPLLEGGFDIYVDDVGNCKYYGTTKFATANYREYEVKLALPARMKELTLHMPHYGSVEALEIGLSEGAKVEKHSAYKHELPIVFYGSSITQGACASRPGITYQNILSRRFDFDYINLGFSGNAKAEDAIVDYMSTLPMCAFVSDYDHNAPSADHLKATHYKMYEKIRAANPDIYYFMISKPDFFHDYGGNERRSIIMESYSKALAAGDRKVHFIDGAAFFTGEDRGDCTLDNCHPNDLGFNHMARVIGDAIHYTMKW